MNPTGTPQVNPETQNLISNFKASNPTAYTAPSSSGDWYSQLKAGAYRPAGVEAPKPVTTFGGDTQGSVGAEMESDVGQRVQNDKQINSSDENLPSKVLGNLGQGAAAIGDVVTDAVKPLIPTSVKNGIKDVAGAVAQTPEAQAVAKAWSAFEKAHPEAASNLKATGNIASLLPIGEGVGQAGEAAEDAGKAGAKAITKVGEKAGAVADAAKTKVVGTPEKQLQSVAKDWESPTTENKPAFNKARAALGKDSETPTFLAKQGLNPYTHVEDGKYVTSDTADALRDTAGKMSHDTLRPSLQIADYTTPKTDVEDIRKAAIKELSGEKNVTAGDKEAITEKINKESAALDRKNPNGLGLTELHDNKITYAKNGGYHPLKSASDNNSSTANRVIGSAMQKAIEQKAPENVPVKAFNNYLSKYYKAADYLDTLNGKTAPVSFGKKVARGVAKFGGAAIGGHIGGGVVSEFAGYQIGKALEHAAENLTTPMRASFLSNLEKTNPEAFKSVENFLRQSAEGNPTVKRLPAPTSIQLPGHDELSKFNTPIKSGGSSVKSVPAERGLPNVNPKTNKFQSTFTSTPK